MDDKYVPEIEGFRVQQAQVGRHPIGYVELEGGITVVFRMADGGSGGSGSDVACILSNIEACANEVCPPIKKADPNASCSDAILECARARCAGSPGFAGVGGLFVIA